MASPEFSETIKQPIGLKPITGRLDFMSGVPIKVDAVALAAEAIVFPDTWGRLSQIIVPDALLLLTGGYSARDRGEDRAPFIVEEAQPLSDLKTSGAIGVAIEWQSGNGPNPEAARALKALCAAHPGSAPVFVHWTDGNGTTAQMRARETLVELDEDFLTALRDLLGSDHVRLVRGQST